jgi:hypothetical protein
VIETSDSPEIAARVTTEGEDRPDEVTITEPSATASIEVRLPKRYGSPASGTVRKVFPVRASDLTFAPATAAWRQLQRLQHLDGTAASRGRPRRIS